MPVDVLPRKNIFQTNNISIVNITYSENLNCNRPNEIYECGSACQTECKTLGEPCPIINIKCNDDCYCIDNYARDDKGNCIPIRDCPPKNNQ
ncbi:hypothetical protein HZH68_002570 [Vespula germanica]|uniref:TIL domain-containing protein n=1 Tax=Vespula germanica TaxID=30212 RepID=A0A834NMH8_VESGE|nr:hypothetical protein HZH68_002570 [Vespula germanica]